MKEYIFYRQDECGNKMQYSRITKSAKAAFKYFGKLSNVYSLFIYDDDINYCKMFYGYYNIYDYLKWLNDFEKENEND